MIKRFFVTLLGTIAGFWISLFLLFLIGVVSLGALLTLESKPAMEVKKKSVLYLDLSGEINERNEQGDIWQVLREDFMETDGLIDIVNAIELAKHDSNIEGIYINGGVSLAGFATREEIVDALKDFKESGKWIYSYSDTYTQGDYLIASLADSVFVNPVGSVDVRGIASQIPFFKNFMDKVGIKMQIVKVGTYKSAVEPFITTEMSPASRLQTQVMIDSVWNYYTSVISDNRGVGVAEVNEWADSMIATWPARRLPECDAVSALRYRRNVENMLKDKTGKKSDEKLQLVTPTEYIAAQKPFNEEKDHIAVLIAAGDIVDAGKEGIVGPVMTDEIIKLADNKHVKALVLRVNSGGGSGFASEQIWEALEYFKSKDKPFYVSMGDYAASGGYYISCGADYIYADHTTLTGSIGVFGMIPDFSNLVSDKIGINFSQVQTNPNAAFPNIFAPLTAEQHGALQKSVEEFYDLFTRRVAEGRGMTQEDVKAIAEGRVWSGGDALRLGLVDRLGGLKETIADIADDADINPENVVYYPKMEENFLVSVITNAQKNVSLQSTSFDRQAVNILRLLDNLSTMNPVQARMPMIELQ